MYLHLIIGTSFLPHPLRNRIVLKSEKYKQVLKKFQKLSFCFSCGEWERAGGFLEKFNVWPEAGYSTVSLVLSYDTYGSPMTPRVCGSRMLGSRFKYSSWSAVSFRQDLERLWQLSARIRFPHLEKLQSWRETQHGQLRMVVKNPKHCVTVLPGG